MKHVNRLPRPPLAPNKAAIKAQKEFNKAFSLHQMGRLGEAQAIYEEVLALQPRHFDSLHLLGLIAFQAGDPQKAVALIEKAISIYPHHADYYINLGMALRALGQLEAAVANYDKALAINPSLLEAHYNRGNALGELNQLNSAIESYERAIAIKPDHAESYYYRGNALKELKLFDAAVSSYDKAIALLPKFAEAYFNRGNALKELNLLDEAVTSYNKAIDLKPGYAEAYYNRANAFMKLGQIDTAVTSYDQVIVLRPHYAEAYCNKGVALLDLKQLQAAAACFDTAITLNPNYAVAYSNRGIALKALGQLDTALSSYDKAIALDPNFVDAYSNRGQLLQDLKQLEAAASDFDAAIALNPNHAEAHFNKSLLLLLNGDFANGWKLYEWRWRVPSFLSPRRNFKEPLWLGAESLEGKTILLYAEQGLGDTIQFCRYAKQVSALGAKVLMEVPKPLFELLRSLDGVSNLIPSGAPLPEFDYQCPLLSLPLAFKTSLDTIPLNQNYLHVDPHKVADWANKLGTKTKRRIGLVWSGNAMHKNDYNRSILLFDLIGKLPQAFEYISLQKEVREIDREILQATPNLRHFGSELHSFTDTAALCELMDVVISVDTSVAHLSSALGKETWVLLPYVPDWRWLLVNEDSPWYPSAKLYRQTHLSDWTSVISSVSEDLIKQTH